MPYDLELVREQCKETGLEHEFVEPNEVAIKLTADVHLYFINSEDEKDCLITLGEGWHTHNHDFEFSGPHGEYVSIHYLDVIVGISGGDILICEKWTRGELKDRWLFHRDYNHEFAWFYRDDEFRIRRAFPTS